MSDEYKPTIIAVDPGKTTGWAMIDANRTIKHGEWPNWLQIVSTLDLLDLSELKEVTCEKFTVGSRTSNVSWQPEAMYLIGTLMHWSWIHGKKFTLQRPSEAKGVFSDAKLRELGLWHSSDHARDATRHLLLNYWRQNKIAGTKAV